MGKKVCGAAVAVIGTAFRIVMATAWSVVAIAAISAVFNPPAATRK